MAQLGTLLNVDLLPFWTTLRVSFTAAQAAAAEERDDTIEMPRDADTVIQYWSWLNRQRTPDAFDFRFRLEAADGRVSLAESSEANPLMNAEMVAGSGTNPAPLPHPIWLRAAERLIITMRPEPGINVARDFELTLWGIRIPREQVNMIRRQLTDEAGTVANSVATAARTLP